MCTDVITIFYGLRSIIQSSIYVLPVHHSPALNYTPAPNTMAVHFINYILTTSPTCRVKRLLAAASASNTNRRHAVGHFTGNKSSLNIIKF